MFVVKIHVGVYSKVDFQEDDLILKDQMLVGAQHSSNKVSDYAKVSFSNLCFLVTFSVVT